MIVRISKRERPFVQIDKRPLENVRLSWKAKGLLSYLMSRPDDWKIRMTQLVKVSSDGQSAVQAALIELRAAGHAELRQMRSEDNAHAEGSEWVIYEEALTSRFSGSQEILTLRKSAPNKKESNKKEISLARSEQVYGIYPRKVGRPFALRAIASAIKKHGFERVLAATKQFAVARPDRSDPYTPHPATFYNQERYLDDPQSWLPKGKRPTAQSELDKRLAKDPVWQALQEQRRKEQNK